VAPRHDVAVAGVHLEQRAVARDAQLDVAEVLLGDLVEQQIEIDLDPRIPLRRIDPAGSGRGLRPIAEPGAGGPAVRGARARTPTPPCPPAFPFVDSIQRASAAGSDPLPSQVWELRPSSSRKPEPVFQP